MPIFIWSVHGNSMLLPRFDEKRKGAVHSFVSFSRVQDYAFFYHYFPLVYTYVHSLHTLCTPQTIEKKMDRKTKELIDQFYFSPDHMKVRLLSSITNGGTSIPDSIPLIGMFKHCIKENAVDCVSFMLKSPTLKHATAAEHDSALFDAITKKKETLAVVLIRFGECKLSKTKNSPLIICIRNNLIGAISALMDSGINPFMPMYEPFLALISIVADGDDDHAKKMVSILLSKCANQYKTKSNFVSLWKVMKLKRPINPEAVGALLAFIKQHHSEYGVDTAALKDPTKTERGSLKAEMSKMRTEIVNQEPVGAIIVASHSNITNATKKLPQRGHILPPHETCVLSPAASILRMTQKLSDEELSSRIEKIETLSPISDETEMSYSQAIANLIGMGYKETVVQLVKRGRPSPGHSVPGVSKFEILRTLLYNDASDVLLRLSRELAMRKSNPSRTFLVACEVRSLACVKILVEQALIPFSDMKMYAGILAATNSVLSRDDVSSYLSKMVERNEFFKDDTVIIESSVETISSFCADRKVKKRIVFDLSEDPSFSASAGSILLSGDEIEDCEMSGERLMMFDGSGEDILDDSDEIDGGKKVYTNEMRQQWLREKSREALYDSLLTNDDVGRGGYDNLARLRAQVEKSLGDHVTREALQIRTVTLDTPRPSVHDDADSANKSLEQLTSNHNTEDLTDLLGKEVAAFDIVRKYSRVPQGIICRGPYDHDEAETTAKTTTITHEGPEPSLHHPHTGDQAHATRESETTKNIAKDDLVGDVIGASIIDLIKSGAKSAIPQGVMSFVSSIKSMGIDSALLEIKKRLNKQRDMLPTILSACVTLFDNEASVKAKVWERLVVILGPVMRDDMKRGHFNPRTLPKNVIDVLEHHSSRLVSLYGNGTIRECSEDILGMIGASEKAEEKLRSFAPPAKTDKTQATMNSELKSPSIVTEPVGCYATPLPNHDTSMRDNERIMAMKAAIKRGDAPALKHMLKTWKSPVKSALRAMIMIAKEMNNTAVASTIEAFSRGEQIV